jgi:hypothetical protein
LKEPRLIAQRDKLRIPAQHVGVANAEGQELLETLQRWIRLLLTSLGAELVECGLPVERDELQDLLGKSFRFREVLAGQRDSK